MAVKKKKKKKLADILDVSATMVGLWCNQKTEPSADMLSKLSKIFNKPEKEIQKIFDFSNSNNIIGDNNSMYINENKQLKERITLLEEKIKFLEEQVLFYKEKSKK